MVFTMNAATIVFSYPKLFDNDQIRTEVLINAILQTLQMRIIG